MDTMDIVGNYNNDDIVGNVVWIFIFTLAWQCETLFEAISNTYTL